MRGEMVLVYRAPTGLEAHVVRTVLEQHDIRAEVRNEMLSSLAGAAVPAGNIIEVWIPAEQLDTARDILEALNQTSHEAGRLSISTPSSLSGALSEAPTPPRHDGLCPACGEEVPESLSECWSCQTELIPSES